MPGLLERARRLVAVKARPSRSSAPVPSQTDESGVSEDERRELSLEIERLFTEKRVVEAISSKVPTGRRSGSGLPLVVGLAAAAVLAAGMLVVHSLSANRTGSATPEAQGYQTTEGLVVQKFKQQSEAQLSEREARIASIKRELDSMRNMRAGSVSVEDLAHQKQLEAELAALQSEASARMSELSTLQSNANTRLAELAARRQRQEFLSRQLQAVYQDIKGNLTAGHLESALGEIASADALLDGSTADPNGEIAVVAPAVRSGNAVLRQALLFGQAAVAASKALDVANMSSQLDELKRSVAMLQTSLRDAQATVSAQKDRIAAQNGTLVDQAALLSRDKIELLKRTEALSIVVNSIQRSIATSSSGVTSSVDQKAGTPDDGLIDLLKTKIAIRQLALTPEARKAYPKLADELDAFFAKYAAIYSEQGRRSTLEALASTLNEVIASLHLDIQTTSSAPLS